MNKQPPAFTEKVLSVVRRIPRGTALTYQQVARRAGSPGAYRAVGNIMNRRGGMERGIPCHRVIKSNGEAGGYNGGTRAKIKKLKREGVVI